VILVTTRMKIAHSSYPHRRSDALPMENAGNQNWSGPFTKCLTYA